MLYVMLVGAYPFERPEDKHDNQKLQKMIQVRREGGGRGCCWSSLVHASPWLVVRLLRRLCLRTGTKRMLTAHLPSRPLIPRVAADIESGVRLAAAYKAEPRVPGPHVAHPGGG